VAYKIVIADDEALICMDLKEMLEEAGHYVVGTASDGAAAVELVYKTRPDLVLLDVKMPRLDGIHAARMIYRERLAPVILLTAYSQREIVAEAAESGVFAYLVKPVNPQQLFPAMEVATAQFRRQQEADEAVARLAEEAAARKTVFRAKGLLMEMYGISEEEAHKRLQQYSMKKGLALKTVALQFIEAVCKE